MHSVMTGPSTCVADSQNLSKANLCRFQRLFITIAHLCNPSKFCHPIPSGFTERREPLSSSTCATLCMRVISHNRRFSMLTAPHVLGVSLPMCRTTQSYIQNTADSSMLLDESLSVQLDSEVHTQSRRIHPQNLGASSTLKQQHRPKYPESQCRRYVSYLHIHLNFVGLT